MNILLLEDSEHDVELLERQLKKAELSFNLHVADSENEYVAELDAHPPDIILSDHSLPAFNSIEALRIARKIYHDIPFILVTGTVSEDFAVQCMKEGADDYILKSSLTRLPAAMANCLAKRQIKREKEMVESLHTRLKSAYEEIEQMNKDITDSINYAKLIQDAVLPEKNRLVELFRESFILYKPKDIISGDFYWFSEIDDKLVVITADCTGHGVPGALMSMIGSNILNEIVGQRRITSPAAILEQMNVALFKLLRKDKDNNRSNDGMDIGVCTIHKRVRKLQFAGAHMPLYYFRERTLTVIKPDRIGIGGFHPFPDREFEQHEIQYDEGDTFYLCSDGYADQFGGKEGKRFQTRNFIDQLQEILDHDLSEQEDILEKKLKDWQGDLKQTDDILVMGIRL
ncbi:MAG TPA: SpoIIE family protein phosphatase [Bacteroidia bacterium]|nr:SpoIIE family protein phosphatase [Bacteroidia bacterium]